MSASPLYVLLSSPQGWVGHAQQATVVHALGNGAWPFDPNETPHGSPPLLEAVIRGFNASGSPLGDNHHARLEAFKAVVMALLDAGAHLDSGLPSISFSGHARGWFERISRSGPTHAKDLAKVEQGLDILEKSAGPGLKNFRQWCVEEKMNLSTVLAGDTLLAHLAAGSCAMPLGLKRHQMGMAPQGWLLHGRNGEGAIWNNQASAHQRLADALVIHRWLEVSDHTNARTKALWWLMAWPLSNPKFVNANAQKRQAFDEVFQAISGSGDLVDALEEVLATSGPVLKPQLAQLILAAAGDLPAATPPPRVWSLMHRALGQLPSPRPELGLEFWWNVEGNPGFDVNNARVAVKAIVERWGWPTLEWAEKASIERSDLANLWAVGLAAGQLPSKTDLPAGHWCLWSLDGETVKWPTRPQVERWFTSNGLRAKAVGWHQESEREEAALARQDVLESQLDSAQPPRPKVRM